MCPTICRRVNRQPPCLGAISDVANPRSAFLKSGGGRRMIRYEASSRATSFSTESGTSRFFSYTCSVVEVIPCGIRPDKFWLLAKQVINHLFMRENSPFVRILKSCFDFLLHIKLDHGLHGLILFDTHAMKRCAVRLPVLKFRCRTPPADP